MLPPHLAEELDLSDSTIRGNFSSAVFQRGREYFVSGRVAAIHVKDDGDGCEVQAQVRGSRRKPYEVVAATRDVTELRGIVKAKKAVSIEEMDLAIRKRAGGR